MRYQSFSPFTGRRARSRHRAPTGSGFVELAGSIAIMIAMVLFALDICVLVMAYGINDRACRDAARAAARGRTRDEALAYARSSIRLHDMASLLIQTPQIDESNFSFITSGQPRVSVTTRTNTRVPAPIFLVGTKVGEGEVAIAKQYTFPLQRLAQRELRINNNLRNLIPNLNLQQLQNFQLP